MKSTRDLVEQAKTSIELISPQDAQNELATGVPLLVDVREPNESEVHISGAVLVPRGLLEFVADPECGPRLPASLQVGLDPTRRVIVYCNTGGRAALAAVTLSQIGYQSVASIDGGLAAWRDTGLPVAEHHAGVF